MLNIALIKTAVTDHEILICWEAIYLLKPMLEAKHLAEQIKGMQHEGYMLLYLFEDHKVVSVAGYRIYSMLYCGIMLYILDLSIIVLGNGKGHDSSLLKTAV